LSIDPYFIILACNAMSGSSSTTIKHELVFEERSHDLDFMVRSTVLWTFIVLLPRSR
jgi:hypothetical protein